MCVDVNAQQRVLTVFKQLLEDVKVHLDRNGSSLGRAVDALQGERSSSERNLDGGVLANASLARDERDTKF